MGLQTEYSLVQRTPEHDLLPMAQVHQMAVLGWAPLSLEIELTDEQVGRLDVVSGIDLGFPHEFLRQEIQTIVYGGVYDRNPPLVTRGG